MRALATMMAVLALGAAYGAPWLYAEFGLRYDGPAVGDKPREPAAGRWVDDYWLVEQLDADTWAIGEPRYYQGNYSYLLVGHQRALLFDGGPAVRDILPVVRGLTTLPVTVFASHLHWDHIGALGRLERTAMLDLPYLRERAPEDDLLPERYEYLGFVDGLPAREFRVDEWWAPGAIVDLGGRRLEVLAIPGHTPDSAALYEPARGALFAGDFVYPSELYAFLPGASRSSYRASTQQLLQRLPPATILYTAHLGDVSGGIRAPRLAVDDLAALEQTLAGIDAGQASAEGVFPRVYPVRGDIVFATGFPWNNR